MDSGDCLGEERSLSSSCRLIVKWLFSTAKWDFCFISYLHLSPCVAWYWLPPGVLQYKHCQHNHPSHLTYTTYLNLTLLPHTSSLTRQKYFIVNKQNNMSILYSKKKSLPLIIMWSFYLEMLVGFVCLRHFFLFCLFSILHFSFRTKLYYVDKGRR